MQSITVWHMWVCSHNIKKKSLFVFLSFSPSPRCPCLWVPSWLSTKSVINSAAGPLAMHSLSSDLLYQPHFLCCFAVVVCICEWIWSGVFFSFVFLPATVTDSDRKWGTGGVQGPADRQSWTEDLLLFLSCLCKSKREVATETWLWTLCSSGRDVKIWHLVFIQEERKMTSLFL